MSKPRLHGPSALDRPHGPPGLNASRSASPRRVLGAALALAFGLTGCATVKPSQRETLSKPEMNPATEGMEEQFQSHVESAREGGFGGHGAAGGGCGCG